MLAAILTLTAADRAMPVVRPGSGQLNLSHIRERNDSIPYLVPNDAHPESPAVTVYSHDEEHLINDARGPALLIITAYRGYIDSAIVLRSTLHPIREFQNYFTSHRRIVYEYDGNHVHVRDSTADSTVRVKDHTYGGDFFHFNELNAVLRSLPLRAGYEALLPLYSEGDDSLEMDSVKVIGKDDRGAWSVRFADPVIVTTHKIDGALRNIISVSGGRRAPLKPEQRPRD